jgi:NTE family protein
MGDYRVGLVEAPQVSVAVAVGASSAFPPFLSPVTLGLEGMQVVTTRGSDLHEEPYISQAVLSDGGVYDNLGLETAFKRFDTILVSDGGAKMSPDPAPHHDWARHSYRVLEVIDNQVRSLRKRQLIGALKANVRKGAYWGIGTHIKDYGLGASDTLPCDEARTALLAAIPTRLAALEPDVQECLINWGYAVCDAALRAHMSRELRKPGGFPYPGSGV